MAQDSRTAEAEIEQMRSNLRELLKHHGELNLRLSGDRELLLDGIMETIWASMTETKPN